MQYELSQSQIRAIENVLAKDDRVELIPVRDGVKIVHVERKEVKA